jgi:hypothetical protein
MSAIGQSTCAVAVNRTTKAMRFNGTNFFRQAVGLTITGHDASPANLVLALYRKGVVVQTVIAFTGDSVTALCSLDTNVTSLSAVYSGVRSGADREFDAILWDKTSEEALARGMLKILGNADMYSAVSESEPTVPEPTTGGWVHLGDDWWNGSNHYRLNNSTGMLRKVWTEGTGDQFHEVYDDAANEIAIPT